MHQVAGHHGPTLCTVAIGHHDPTPCTKAAGREYRLFRARALRPGNERGCVEPPELERSPQLVTAGHCVRRWCHVLPGPSMSCPTPDWRLPTLRRPRLESAPSGPTRGPLGANKAIFAPTLHFSGPLGAPQSTLSPPSVHPLSTLSSPQPSRPCIALTPLHPVFAYC